MNTALSNGKPVWVPGRFLALKIALAYALFGSLWILSSGFLLYGLVREPEVLLGWELAKGSCFVLVTSLLMGLMTEGFLCRVRRSTVVMQQNEQRFRSLFEHMLHGFAYCRMVHGGARPRDFVLLEVNEACEKLTGLKDMVGKRVTEIVPGIHEADPELFEILGRVSSTGVPEKFEIYLNALKTWFAVSAYSPQKDHFVAVFDMITERKNGEAVLRKQTQFSRTILDHAPIGFAVNAIDDGAFQYVNARFEAIYGVPRGSLRSVGEFFEVVYADPVQREQMRERVMADIASGDTARMCWADVPITTRTGESKVVTAVNIPLFDQNLMVSTVMDVTQRKQAETELHQLNHTLEERVAERTTRLEAANKELEAFSYSVSHDLRAPLRAVDGFGRILEQHSGDRLDPEGLRILGIIRGETTRMGKLIDDLLAFSRLGRRQMQFSAIDMAGLAGVVFAECAAPVPERKIHFKTGPLSPAWGDPAMVRQVLANLLSNAVKYTNRQELAEIEVGSRIEARENVYWIKDNGVGFDMRYADKLFGIFQRLHGEEEFEGTGVGLALVQRIVQRHGGRVWAESKLNEGACFYFTLINQRD